MEDVFCLTHMFTKSRYFVCTNVYLPFCDPSLITGEKCCVIGGVYDTLKSQVTGYYDESLFSLCYDYSCHPKSACSNNYCFVIKFVL